jgi:hypothetical protein
MVMAGVPGQPCGRSPGQARVCARPEQLLAWQAGPAAVRPPDTDRACRPGIRTGDRAWLRRARMPGIRWMRSWPRSPRRPGGLGTPIRGRAARCAGWSCGTAIVTAGYRFEAAQVEDDGTLRITRLDRGPGSASCSVTRSRPTNGSTWSPRTGSAPCSGSSAGQDGDEVLAVLAAYHRRASGRLSGILQNPEVAHAFTNWRS